MLVTGEMFTAELIRDERVRKASDLVCGEPVRNEGEKVAGAILSPPSG